MSTLPFAPRPFQSQVNAVPWSTNCGPLTSCPPGRLRAANVNRAYVLGVTVIAHCAPRVSWDGSAEVAVIAGAGGRVRSIVALRLAL